MNGNSLDDIGEWFEAFPLLPAQRAMIALCESWNVLTSNSNTFHPKMKEPKLTKTLKIHIERVSARNAGLLGMWAAENVIGVLDPETGTITEERRNDIVFGWNDDTSGVSIQLVFECKKLSRAKQSRSTYVGKDGMGRFVTGIYGIEQPLALMVGFLLDPHEEAVPPLIALLETEEIAANLNIVQTTDKNSCETPSIFDQAEFDTTHTRPPELAASHGTIRVAHLFLTFNYDVQKT